ncbi:MAG TPA: ATP-binding protein [Gemmatimonadaceae bacterium]|nr:ATP-binding protein [Gemmatimonadaceae bacterium]
MLTIRRRWQSRWKSIDRKLPLLASGLVLLTALIVGVIAYALVQRELVRAAEQRLKSTATLVAQMVQRPAPRRDSLARVTDRSLVEFLRGRLSRDAATAALARARNPMDTTRVFAALLDPAGRTLLAHHRPPAREPAWPLGAVRRGDVSGDSVSLGPIENLGGAPAYSLVYPLRDSLSSAPLGYVVETRVLASRMARGLRGLIGPGVQLALGQPGQGIWTDFESVMPTPTVLMPDAGILNVGDEVSASARIAGTNWVVWLSQPNAALIAPARTVLWTLVPIGLLIALVGAALMWRMAHRIARPIAELTVAAEGVSRQSTSTTTPELPLEHCGADEMTRLRIAFERMATRVAEREALEIQLRHSQKMEAVGRLAGGIAHDFNNLLTAIRSYADLMLEDLPQWDAKRGDVEEIRKAAHRAAGLTAQLLAFSRKQMLQPRVLDLGVVLRDVHGMLKRLLIEDIQIAVETSPDLWPVKADRGQLEQVIVNLAVNARDAMPQGGTLTITASNERVSAPVYTKDGKVPTGSYVAISVTDTGLGMDEATQLRLFEPFFTTKAVGQGTGLGLATVHGIVAQSGGYITVKSELSEGATFRVYLPRALEAPIREPGSGPVRMRGNNETVLLVEDEPAVRALARRVLVRAGFRVLESTTPRDALALARDHSREIKLVLSDVVMPEMSGPTLVSRVLELCPQARVLYISGYTDDEVIGRGLSTQGMLLLQKPFSAQQLVERVRVALDAA